ncbi:hypothetical protein B0A49_01820, partial [Cryomyces minteri]
AASPARTSPPTTRIPAPPSRPGLPSARSTPSSTLASARRRATSRSWCGRRRPASAAGGWRAMGGTTCKVGAWCASTGLGGTLLEGLRRMRTGKSRGRSRGGAGVRTGSGVGSRVLAWRGGRRCRCGSSLSATAPPPMKPGLMVPPETMRWWSMLTRAMCSLTSSLNYDLAQISAGFMAHPEILLPIPTIDDPVERFVAVTKFYLSGWHIKPPGVKKPLNPILGETFTGYWEYKDGTRGYYISEQTSHHPPKSSYFYMAPEHRIRIDGTLKPRSKFLGNSAASMMEGIAVMRLLNRGERFFVTQPNMYARGILFGKMKYELGDHAYIRCPETGLEADIEFKTKGYFSGTYNAIGGSIKDRSGKSLFELSGLWSGEMFIKNLTTNKKDLLFDASHARETPPSARPLSEQSERESQKLWYKVTQAVKIADQNTATDEKSRIENMQRDETAKRAEQGIEWHPKLFRKIDAGGRDREGEEGLDWILDADIDGRSPGEQSQIILSIAPILPGQQQHQLQQRQHQNEYQQQYQQPRQEPQLQRQPQQQQSQPSSQPSYSQQQQQTTHPYSIPQGSNDLVDFGQNDGVNSSSSSHIGFMGQMRQESKDIEHPDNGGGQFGIGLQQPMKPTGYQPERSVRRQDSDDGRVEEFVDAES